MDRPMTDAERIAAGLTEAQRECGDLLDDFPCIQCGAKGPGGCTLPPSAVIPARDAINATPGLIQLLHVNVRRKRAILMRGEG